MSSFAQLAAHNSEESNLQIAQFEQDGVASLNLKHDFVFNSSTSDKKNEQTKLDVRILETQEEDEKSISSNNNLITGCYFTKTTALQSASNLFLFNIQKRLLPCKQHFLSTSRHIVFQVFRI